MSTLAPPTLAREDWLEAASGHRSRARAWTQPTRDRRARGVKHPVHDFLHTYYRLSLGKLERWHPGLGVLLEDCPEARDMFQERYYRFKEGACSVDPARLEAKSRERLQFTLSLLRATQSRPPNFACHGLHEWAMVYQGMMVRHEKTAPLRLPQEEIDALVRARPLCCSHFDAFTLLLFDPSDIHPLHVKLNLGILTKLPNKRFVQHRRFSQLVIDMGSDQFPSSTGTFLSYAMLKTAPAV